MLLKADRLSAGLAASSSPRGSTKTHPTNLLIPTYASVCRSRGFNAPPSKQQSITSPLVNLNLSSHKCYGKPALMYRRGPRQVVSAQAVSPENVPSKEHCFPTTKPFDAAQCLLENGFVVVEDAITPEQLLSLQTATSKVVQNILEADPLHLGNRNVRSGGKRYSIGSIKQFPEEEWCGLVDALVPTALPVLEALWGSRAFLCNGAGGDFCLPGCSPQPLHSDMVEASVEYQDPQGVAELRDLPPPWICINVPLVDFTPLNGATRQIPGTQRSHRPIPALHEEPPWMQAAHVSAPAGAALIRDLRGWHGGTPNRLPVPPPGEVRGRLCLGPETAWCRPMLNVEFSAPWFRVPHRDYQMIPREWWERMSDRGREVTRHLVLDDRPRGAGGEGRAQWDYTFGEALLQKFGPKSGSALTGQ